MKKNRYIEIIGGEQNLDSETEFTFCIQKAMLLSLLEAKQITLPQYNYAVDVLEKKIHNKINSGDRSG